MDKLFLDANVIFSAVCSDAGASRFLFQLAGKKKIILFSSFYAVNEAKVNIERKLKAEKLVLFYKLVSEFTKIDNFNYDFGKKYEKFIIEKDVPILVGAETMEADFLLTLDKKDFMNTKISKLKLPFKIMSPGEYLRSLIK
ncbi:MAG: PIN domain-containing protein [Candidatus Peregrinibacteria bacterium]|nr:PIN domain-containing protein [Candidatus Peregrinibacteria bacterium]